MKQHEIDELNELRMLNLTAHVLLPLVEEKRKQSYEKLLGDFRHNHSANIALVAECNAYSSLIEEIHYKLKTFENLSNKEN